MKLKMNKFYGILFISLFLLISVQPYITYALEQNPTPTKIFLAAKPSLIINQHSTVFNAKLTQKIADDWSPLTNQEIEFFIEISGQWMSLGSSMTDETGHAVLEIFIELPENRYLVKAIYSGNLFHTGSVDEKHINVLEETHDVILSESQYVVPWGDTVNLTAMILNPSEQPIPNRPLNISVYLETQEFTGWVPIPKHFNAYEDEEGNPQLDIVYNLTTGKNKVAVLPYVPLPLPGLFDLKVSFQGGKSNGIGEKIFWNALQVTRRTSHIEINPTFVGYYGDPVTLTGQFLDHANYSIMQRDVNIYLMNEGSWNLIATVNTGDSGSIEYEFLPNLDPEIYQLKIEFLGDGLFTACSEEIILEIVREISVINDGYIKVDVSYTDSKDFQISLTDDEHDPLGNKELKIYRSYDFTTYSLLDTVITDSDGIATSTYVATEVPGTYSLRIDFAGDFYYQPKQIFGVLSISKERVKISVEDIAYQDPTTPVTFIATIREDDNPPVPGVLLKFYLVSATQELFMGNATSGSNGRASFTRTIDIDPETENLVIFARYEGSALFFEGSGHDSILVPPKPGFASVTATQMSSGIIQIDVHLTDEDNNPITLTTVDIVITDSTINQIITVTTDSNGFASTTFDPLAYVGRIFITATSPASNYEIAPVQSSLIAASGVATIIDLWIIFCSGAPIWWENLYLGLAAGGIAAAIIGLAALLAWIQGGDWLQGIGLSLWAIGFAIALGIATMVVDLIIFAPNYNTLGSSIVGSIGRLGDGTQTAFYSSKSGDPNYLSPSSTSAALDSTVKDPTIDDVGLIILGEDYRQQVKNWFQANPTYKNKLYLTVLDYDVSENDQSIYNKGYTVAFGIGLYMTRNTMTQYFFGQLETGTTDVFNAIRTTFYWYVLKIVAAATLFGILTAVKFTAAGLLFGVAIGLAAFGLYLAFWFLRTVLYINGVQYWSGQ